MTEANAASAPGQGTPVQDLIRQREQLVAWIGRLGEVSDVPSRVAERVRADYETRLREVTEALAQHGGAIEADLARTRDALEEAETRRAAAGDALEEMRLRHMIGEVDKAAWERARGELESEVSDADEGLAGTRAELERLEALSADIAAAASAAAAPATEPPPAAAASTPPEPSAESGAVPPSGLPDEPTLPEGQARSADDAGAATGPPGRDAPSVDDWDPFGGEFALAPGAEQGDAAEDLPWLEDLDKADKGWSAAAAAADEAAGEEKVDDGLQFLTGVDAELTKAEEPSGDLAADDLAFLEELDRAISTSPPPSGKSGGGAAGASPPAETDTPATSAGGASARAEPLLCKECGAINEPHAWYCEICGSEL